jgi:hypothetical protein
VAVDGCVQEVPATREKVGLVVVAGPVGGSPRGLSEELRSVTPELQNPDIRPRRSLSRPGEGQDEKASKPEGRRDDGSEGSHETDAPIYGRHLLVRHRGGITLVALGPILQGVSAGLLGAALRLRVFPSSP